MRRGPTPEARRVASRHAIFAAGALFACVAGADPSLAQTLNADRPGAARVLVEQAIAYEHGEGVPRNPIKAASLYCEAARLGDAEAQFALGWMFANGRGVSHDEAIAAALFRRAAAQGHAQADKMLRYVSAPDERLPSCITDVAQAPASGREVSDDSTLSVEEIVQRLPPEKRKVAEIVRRVAAQHAVSPQLALAIARAESNFEPSARSPKNALGVMQLIPETAARFNVRNVYDPADNIRGGVIYLRWLLAYYRGRVPLAIAAYNAGEGAVDRHRGVPPYPETRDYVKRVIAWFGAEEHPYDASVVDPSPMLRASLGSRY
ncbi:MAG: transglycosylase SLT domain-containing protein [Burkholderiales bacterium]|jgi:soluble lytic murein transglycosylase-like protein|nr:transglycosylase SLT domain-containing protein [Burkholderiales bacterium]